MNKMKPENNETYEQKRRRLFGKVNFLPEYLNTLRRILKTEVTTNQLLTIVDTDDFLSRNKSWLCVYKETIPFEDKNKLKEIVHSIEQDESIPYLIWLDQSTSCGLYMIPNLSAFNWDFKFDDDPNGIISLMRRDGKKEIVLDFYEEDNQNLLDIKFNMKIP